MPYGKAALELRRAKLKGLRPFGGQGGVIDWHPECPDFLIVYPSYWSVPSSVRRMLVARGVIAPGGQVYDFLWETAREKADVELGAWYAAFGIKLCLDSLSCAVLVTHEQNISVLNNDEWDMLLSRVDQLTSKYEKIYKSWTYIAEYAENLFNSKLSYANLDPSTGRVECRLEGRSTVPLYRSIDEVFGDLRVMERIPGGSSKSLADTRRRLCKIMEQQSEHGFSLWTLVRKVDGRLIGDCGLILVEVRGPEIELSYDIAYEFWGRGFATEAARECLRYGLEDLELERIVGLTYEDHRASRRVMEKIGMTYERIVHHYNRDLVQYSATKKEERTDL